MTTNYKINGTDIEGRYLDKTTIYTPNTRLALFGTGDNTYGQLGVNDTTHRSSLTMIRGVYDWKKIFVGNTNTIAIRNDNTLWGWGYNTSGQLGLGDTIHRSSPIKISNSTDWSQICVNAGSILALKTDGTLWAWGENSYGQLGLGDRTHRSSPIQIGALNNWKQISGGNGGSRFSAIKTDGTLWSWGYNGVGALGLGDTNNRSSPTQVGSLTNWKQVSCGNYMTIAIKTDGTMWGCGINSYGSVGPLGTGNILSFTQIDAATNWNKVYCGAYHSHALKTDGTLWSWGSNSYGELGTNLTGSYNGNLAQINTSTDWADVQAGNYYTYALKTDGSVYYWGQAPNNPVGTWYKTPQLLSSDKNFKSISVDYNNAFFTKLI